MDSGYTILDFQYHNQIYSVLVAKKLVSYEKCIGFEFMGWSYARKQRSDNRNF